MLTSFSEVQTPGPSVGPGEELTDFKRQLEVVSRSAVRLPRAVQRRKAVSSRQALRDMRIPAEIKELLTGLLQQLNYTLDETTVFPEYDAQDARRISVAHNDGDTRHLLHIPRTALKKTNLAEFGLLRYIFRKGDWIYIISPNLNTFPDQSFERMADSWQAYDNKKIHFINWKWLKALDRPDPELVAFAQLFKPPLASNSNDEPSSAEHPLEENHEYVAPPLRRQTSTSFPTRSDGGRGYPNIMAPGLNLPRSDREWIMSEFTRLATNTPPDPKDYYRYLVARADLPDNWVSQLSGSWSGNAPLDALKLINWALSRGVNPKDTRYTTLGSLLTVLLEDQGFEEQNRTVALIYAHNLYRDTGLLASLAARYQVPIPASERAIADQTHASPEFVLREQLDDVELQGLLGRQPDFLDVGFLSRAIEKAASICRVEMNNSEPLGTGFLVAPQKLLTNYHVVNLAPGKDPAEKAGNLQLRFRSVTAANGRESEGQIYRPDPSRPLLRASPVERLDYALIQVEERIITAVGVVPITYSGSRQLRKGMGLNILGHPQGGPMKLAISDNGVAGAYYDVGLVQYATRALNGSSGSPCFDEDWRPVAIHHAELAKSFGSVREGVLLGPIFDEIGSLL